MPRKAFKYPYKYKEGDHFLLRDDYESKPDDRWPLYWITRTAKGYYYVTNAFYGNVAYRWAHFEHLVQSGVWVQVEGPFL